MQIIALDTATPQLRTPPSGSTYSAPRAIAMTPETLTGSSATSSLSIAQTWNTTGTPTAIDLNVTDTASNASSLLMDLRVGGTSQFSVSKIGGIIVSGGGNATFAKSGNNKVGIFLTPSTTSLDLANDTEFGWSANAAVNSVKDTILRRDAANTLAQRNGVNAQTLRVYGTFTDASNYERLSIGYSAGVSAFVIQREQAGTGAQRALYLNGGAHVFGVGAVPSGAYTWTIAASGGHLVAGLDNTYDIGASGANRPRYLYLGGGSLTGSQADSSLVISPTWNTTGTPTAIDLNVTDTASNAASLLMNLRVGGTSRFSVSKTGAVVAVAGANTVSGFYVGGSTANGIYSPNTSQLYLSGGGSVVEVRASGLGLGTSSLSWGTLGSTQDTFLARDAANTLAQRNGVNAQAFRVYNSFTDASNGEWLGIRWSSNDILIGVQANGTGSTNRQMHFASSSFRFFVGSGANATSWYINADGSFTYEGTGSGFIALREQTAPSAPAADRVRIFAQDNGAGKTQLMALFATGAAQQIAIEP